MCVCDDVDDANKKYLTFDETRKNREAIRFIQLLFS